MDSSESPFRFDNRENYAVLTLNPLINDGQWGNVTQVGTEILNRLDAMPSPRLVIDLSPLDYMGSAQVALLVRVWKAIKKTEGGRMVVECPGQMVREVLAIAGLKSLWEIVDTREAALSALGVSDEARHRAGWLQPALVGAGGLAVLAAAGLILTGPHVAPLSGLLAGTLMLALLVGLVLAFRAPGWRRWMGAGIAVAGTALVGLSLSGWSPDEPPQKVAAAGDDAVGDSRAHPPTALISDSKAASSPRTIFTAGGVTARPDIRHPRTDPVVRAQEAGCPMTTHEQAREVRQRALQEELRELLDVVGPVPLVDLLLERAFHLRATDIHLDPSDDGLRIRLRVDGLLHEVLRVPPPLMPQMISRIKLMAGMDITERRSAQDGHIASQTLSHDRDIRVGGGPTIHGERLVLRLMPDSQSLHRLEDLGLEEDQVAVVQNHVQAASGMVLSVGPVGSGKSTTMYSCLELLNDPSESLVTIEDPVERRIPGVNQIQVDPKINFNFVEALRGVLRQDPDVMMIGEIRDPETAQIGVRAGLTGVTVLSTLHANDTASTIDVFRDFGIPPMFIADSLQCIISQRLLRKVCPRCRTTSHPDEIVCALLGVEPARASTVNLAQGTGCDACFGTGYSGRTGVFEIMSFDRELRHAVLKGAPRGELMELACSKGMRTLQSSAIRKVLAGKTTVEEMHRVLTSFSV